MKKNHKEKKSRNELMSQSLTKYENYVNLKNPKQKGKKKLKNTG